MDGALREIGMTTGFVTPQTTNAVLMNLEAAGLVVRRLLPEHGRVLQSYVTEEGEEPVSKAHRVVEATERRMPKSLRQQDQHRLLGALCGCAHELGSGAGSAAPA